MSSGGGGNGGNGGGGGGTPALTANVTTQGNFSNGEQNAAYNITVSNTGNAATSGTVTVADPPSGFTITAITGAGWTCTLSSATCTRTDALAAGQSFPPITVTGNVTASNGTPVSIPLNVSGGGATTPITSSPSVTVAAPALTITKAHTGNFNLGQQGATYTVTVKNGTSAGATNAKVTVTETVPSGETLVSMAGSGWTCPGSGGANTCDRSDTLTSGASYPAITVAVNVSATAASPQVNQVSASGGGISSAVPGSDSTAINMPDLSIAKSHVGAFTAGSNGTFNIAVSNASTAGPALGTVTVTDTLDSHFTFVSGTASGWTCSAVSQVVTCTNPGPLAAGASAMTIPLVVAVSTSASGTISNTATVATFGDGNTANNSSTDSVPVTTVPPDLSITKSHTGTFSAAANGTFNIAVKNIGTGPTTGPITVTDTLASSFTFVSGTATGWACSASGQAVTCTNPGPINAGASANTISLVVAVNSSASGSVSNTAAVATAGDSNATNNSSADSVSVAAAPPDLSITKSHTGTFTAGTNGTFNIAVSNIGTGPTTGTITVTDTLASAFTFVSGSAAGWTCGASGQNVTCTNPGPINPGASAATIPLLVAINTSASGSISNTAVVATAGDSNAANNSSTDTVTVLLPPPDFSISVSQSSLSVEAGTTSTPVTVSVTALNGFSGSVSVNVPGLPTGVSCSPACPLTIIAGTPVQVSFVVPAGAIVTSVALNVQGTSGSLNHSKPLNLNVTTSLQGFWNFWQNDALVSQNPASVTGKIFVSGWGFEKIPVTAVSILVDNSSIGNAIYGTQRPDIPSGIPGAPEDCGFSLALDTTTLTNGVHTVSVTVADSVGNVAAMENYPNNLPAIQINVNNPPSTAAGPVANLTLNAPTTSLTVGTIVQFMASATDGSGNPVSPSFTWSSTAPTVAKVNPAGDLFPLAAGTATISVSAGGKTQQVGVTVQAGSGTQGSIQVSIGAPEVVFKYNRDACKEADYPDNPARAVRLNDGSLLLIAGSPPYFANFGADFYSLKRDCTNPVLVSADSPVASAFANMQWIFSVYSDGSTIHALIHNEFHDPIAATCKPGDTTDSNPCQYNSVTYATSVDNGHSFAMATAPQNLAAPPPVQWAPPAQGSPPPYYGYQEPTNIVHAADGYYYAQFGAFTPPPNVSGLSCVMRTTTLSDPSSWRAWNGTSFTLQMTDPYTSSPTSFCANTGTTGSIPYESLTFDTYLNAFTLVGFDNDFTSNGTPINCGLHFALSSNAVNWSTQQLIEPAYVGAPSGCQKPGAGLAGVFAYGSLIDPDDTTTNFENPGRTGYIYFTRFNDNLEDRDLVRVAVMFTKY